ncbi:hypothetical protein IQ241_16695 [Romeria aff. gracilis LEGE 07310]|uniref:Uncharacterized protein n=1 Tax=Vasconcelosia minhoensis LEGE 07310 TaxID=915328 RepID=A0A8J7AGW2_9CYAN|nr:hypothetical protein [Romeria gracilis]MBE9078911.1 hypothetical protein [Romeria aff. gracilis LEGE 07310]
MGLAELPLRAKYRRDRAHSIQDFYLPCLDRATRYDRAVGFFASTSMAAVVRGLEVFIRSGGRMRLVASPCLSAEDVTTIEQGLSRRDAIVGEALSRSLALALSAEGGAF